MRELYLTLCVFVINGYVNCKYYFVTAPNVIRFEHDETVVVSVFGLNNARVKVWLQYKGKRGGFQERSEVEDKPRTLQICSEYQRSTQFRDVVISYQSGYLIVQTDKPINTPQQKVNIRTLALEESLKPSAEREVVMEIISPTNLMVWKKIRNSLSGFIQHDFTLPPYPDLGTWTARAFYRGRFETLGISQFEVNTYVLPTFGVSVDIDVPYILRDTANIQVTVKAKYVYGKTVEGKAHLVLNLKDKLGSSEHIMGIIDGKLQNNGDIEFSIETDKILSSTPLKDRGFPVGSLLEIITWVTETVSGKEEAGRNEIMFVKKPYRFNFSRSKVNFRPGFEFYLKVDVTSADGKPVENQNVSVHIVKNGRLENTQVKKTGPDGKFVAIFPTFWNGVYIFRSADVMMVFTNYDMSGRFTGMSFMVVTRGKVVYTAYEREQFQNKSIKIPENIQEYITPSARLLVFYVEKTTNELVADSIRFDVEKKCGENWGWRYRFECSTELKTLYPTHTVNKTNSKGKLEIFATLRGKHVPMENKFNSAYDRLYLETYKPMRALQKLKKMNLPAI